MTQEQFKQKWIPVLAVFIPLLLAIVTYAVTNERRHTIHERNDIHQAEQIENNYKLLKESLDIQRRENREDHQEIFRLLRGEP